MRGHGGLAKYRAGTASNAKIMLTFTNADNPRVSEI